MPESSLASASTSHSPPVERWRLLRLIWPFVATVALLLLLGDATLHVMRGVRAYVSAESLWADAQKNAVNYLEQYAQTRNEDYFVQYQTEIAVTLGDRNARLALDHPRPDRARAIEGLLEGRNHPDDIGSMIDLFLRFRSVGFMARAIDLWVQADAQVAELDFAAHALQRAIAAGVRDPGDLAPYLTRVRTLDRDLTSVMRAFGATFDEASRRMEVILTAITVAIALLLLALVALRTRRMIREGTQFERALRQSEERFQHAVSGTNDGIWDWSLAHASIYFSPRFEHLLGHAPGTLRATPAAFLRLVHAHDRRRALAQFRHHLATGEPLDLEFRLRTRERTYRWFRTRGRSFLGAGGKPVRMAGSLADISERKQSEAALFEQTERAQVTLASIADAVITVSVDGTVEFLNPVAERLTGWFNNEARRLAVAAVFRLQDEASGEALADPVARALREGCAVKSEGNVALRRRDDSPVAIDYSAAPIRDRAGTTVGVVLVFHDMSRERQYASRLAHLASHDALTGLPNRREFERRVSAILREARDRPGSYAVLYLDLDEFKLVNDTCGHAAGDELLRQVSALLRQRLREMDTLARLGGDEFGVLLAHCAPASALRVAETLRKTIGDFHFVWKQRPFRVHVSIGLVSLGQGTRTLAQVLSAADAACYIAKDKGRNRVQVWSSESDELAVRHGEMEWASRLHGALERNRFCLYAQPLQAVRRESGHTRYTELLLRLTDDNGEIVPPMSFIPAAERYHLMPAVDRWVVATAFGIMAQYAEAGLLDSLGICAINVSGASLSDDEFLDYVQQQFVHHRIPHAAVCFEITETTAVTSLNKAVEFMTALRGCGCRFALDDFGVGVSSFTYLKHLPVDFLKIDGAFVKDLLQDPVDRAMVEAINRIGHLMGKLTIAESVENTATLEALRGIGVDYAQGFGIAAPERFAAPSATRLRLVRRLSASG
ncbi:MAG TPA: EAL domain-containing protein [Casimicrobiaceae bacterium]|nr:EAL domain-containing protein [Casimicrobiaceae bacterium]